MTGAWTVWRFTAAANRLEGHRFSNAVRRRRVIKNS
jgi:hypothetical protein